MHTQWVRCLVRCFMGYFVGCFVYNTYNIRGVQWLSQNILFTHRTCTHHSHIAHHTPPHHPHITPTSPKRFQLSVSLISYRWLLPACTRDTTEDSTEGSKPWWVRPPWATCPMEAWGPCTPTMEHHHPATRSAAESRRGNHAGFSSVRWKFSCPCWSCVPVIRYLDWFLVVLLFCHWVD